MFDDATEVASLGFRFPNGRSLSTDRLRREIVLSEGGFLEGVSSALSFLPLVPDAAPHPFQVIELQRDVARLRRLYAESGFIHTDISYDVQYHEQDNSVDVTFIIDEGEPILLRTIAVVTGEAGDPAAFLPDTLVDDWTRFMDRRRRQVGNRLTIGEEDRHTSEVLTWWLDRGWAFARAAIVARVDTAAASADLTIRLDLGARAHVGEIEIVGNESVSDDVIRRVLPFRTGDWYSARQVAEGQRRLFGLELFRLALVDVAEDQSRDSTALVRIRLQESPLRLVTGEIGYVQSGGVSVQGEFAHRNFLGGARTLRLNGVAQTGQLAAAQTPEKNYRLSLSYRRPFTFHPRMSLTVAPFFEYRDDLIDRSRRYGIENSLVYELGAFRYVTLTHRYSTRRVFDFRLGSGNAVDLLTLLELEAAGALDSIGRSIERNTLALSATIGRFDPTRPLRALQARPVIESTVPAALNTIEYASFDLPVVGLLPLNERVALAARVRFGRVYPYGKTVAGDSVAGLLEALQLRDVLMSAGGTGSGRGWADNLLGPKFLDLRIVDPTSVQEVELATRGWAPSGGLARATGSVELRLPFPGLGESWGTHLFLDAGRVWTPDKRFTGDDPLDEQRWFFGTGAGVDLRTIVGPIRISFGYKLNPSPLDLRDPQDVYNALVNERPITSAPTSWWRRVHVHIGLGQNF